MSERGSLVVISGFSGAGKGTIVRGLMDRYDNYALSVSATTRKPREGEEEGVHYFFRSIDEFEKMIASGELYEYACYVGNYYGTPKEYVQRMRALGKDVILEIEVQGALKVKEQDPDALLLFVSPPDAGELVRRLTERGTETPEAVGRRMRRACEEALLMSRYDYLILNDDLDECISSVHALIGRERLRMRRNQAFIDKITDELNAMKGEQL